jgi:hypothetical protein
MISSITTSRVFGVPAVAMVAMAPPILTLCTCKILEQKGIIKPSTTYLLTAAATAITFIATSIALTTLGMITIKISLFLVIPALIIAGTFLALAYCNKSKGNDSPVDLELEKRTSVIIQKLKQYNLTLRNESVGNKLQLAEQMLQDKKPLSDVVKLTEETTKEIETLTKDPEPFLSKHLLTYFYDIIVNEKGDHKEILTQIDGAIKRLDSDQIAPPTTFNAHLALYVKKHNMNTIPPEQRLKGTYKRYPCKP